ncbi:MAG: DNA repair protein RadC [Deltaproteobacteria bacterium]|nr:DNA repair protein RadC [Deltaproteobacteria bacterium]
MRCPTEQDLGDHELLAELLRIPADQALRLLRSCAPEGVADLHRLPDAELGTLAGVGPARVRRLRLALELGRRATAPAPRPGAALRSSGQVAEYFRCRLQDRERESIHALLLDGKNRPVRHICAAEGSWTCCALDPKIVLAACLRHAAPALILIHNHPSGDPSPSRDDLELTERMKRAAGLLGIQLVDHLIVARQGHCSLAESGWL